MQWNDVTPDNMPEPGEPVLGLWGDGSWDRMRWTHGEGWYDIRQGAVTDPPSKWCRVNTSDDICIQAGSQDAHLLSQLCYAEWMKTEQELQAIRNGDSRFLPVPLQGKDRDYLNSQIDPWCSSVMQARSLYELFKAPKQAVKPAEVPAAKPKEADAVKLALDGSLEKARALHRVWRALNDGDCPKCHTFSGASAIIRDGQSIQCPACSFTVWRAEIDQIQEMFAPAMDAAVKIFEDWRVGQPKQMAPEPQKPTAEMFRPGCGLSWRQSWSGGLDRHGGRQ